MNEIQYNILKQLVGDKYINAPILAEELDISLRTTRYQISNLKTLLKKSDVFLHYSNSRGYYLLNKDILKIELLMNDLTNFDIKITNKKHRQIFIMGELLQNKRVNKNYILDKTYCQENTIMGDITNIRKILKPYGIQVCKNVDYIWIEGSFKKKSQLVINFLITESHKEVYNNSYDLQLFFYEKIDYRIIDQLSIAYRNQGIKDDNRFVKFQSYWYLYYVIKNLNITELNERKLIEQIGSCLEKNEYKLLIDMLSSIGYHHNISKATGFKYTMIRFFRNIEKEYNLPINYQSGLFELLAIKVYEVFLQQQLAINFLYVDTEKIVIAYPYSFSIAQQLLNYLSINLRLNRDQVAYLTVAVQDLLFNSEHSKAILIVSNSNEEIVNYYSRWIEYQYSKNIKILTCESSKTKDLLNAHNNEIKMILNFEKNTISSKQNTLNLAPLISSRNVNLIDNNLKRESGNYLFMERFIYQRLLSVYLSTVSFFNIISRGAKRLVDMNVIDDADEFVKQCILREEVGTTYVGNETMLVHPLNYSSNSSAISIAIINNGINVEGNIIKIIIICALKKEVDFDASRLFEIIMKIIGERQYADIIINSDNEMELLINLQNILKKM